MIDLVEEHGVGYCRMMPDTYVQLEDTWMHLHMRPYEAAGEPPTNLHTQIFHREVETVAQFAHELQKVSSLAGLTDAGVGWLSIFHDNAVYKHGYGSEEARLMAHV